MQNPYRQLIHEIGAFNIQEHYNSFLEESGYNNEQLQTQDQQPKIVVHRVTIDDTLEGLSLQYGVSPLSIREFNGLTSDSIYYIKEIKIPNPQSFYESQEPTEQGDSLKYLQKLYFVQYILESDDKSDKMATYYLESSNWNMEAAAKEYQEDVKFEKQSKKTVKISKNKVKVE